MNRERTFNLHTIPQIAPHYPSFAMHWLERSEIQMFPSATVCIAVERVDKDAGEGEAVWVVMIPQRSGISSSMTASSSGVGSPKVWCCVLPLLTVGVFILFVLKNGLSIVDRPLTFFFFPFYTFFFFFCFRRTKLLLSCSAVLSCQFSSVCLPELIFICSMSLVVM